jgi:hypothetical protein
VDFQISTFPQGQCVHTKGVFRDPDLWRMEGQKIMRFSTRSPIHKNDGGVEAERARWQLVALWAVAPRARSRVTSNVGLLGNVTDAWLLLYITLAEVSQ